MFTKSVSKIFTVLFVLAVALLTTSFILRSAPASAVDRSSAGVETKEQALREYVLGERYGALPLPGPAASVEELAQREYEHGERYGVTPRQYASEKALREYWLGERYGQTP